jgi:hypothetical protein
LKELEQVGQGYAHEKSQTTPDIIEKSKRVRFGYLGYIQGAQVTKIKIRHCETRGSIQNCHIMGEFLRKAILQRTFCLTSVRESLPVKRPRFITQIEASYRK